jgi:hypothetical protein
MEKDLVGFKTAFDRDIESRVDKLKDEMRREIIESVFGDILESAKLEFVRVRPIEGTMDDSNLYMTLSQLSVGKVEKIPMNASPTTYDYVISVIAGTPIPSDFSILLRSENIESMYDLKDEG